MCLNKTTFLCLIAIASPTSQSSYETALTLLIVLLPPTYLPTLTSADVSLFAKSDEAIEAKVINEIVLADEANEIDEIVAAKEAIVNEAVLTNEAEETNKADKAYGVSVAEKVINTTEASEANEAELAVDS